MIVCLETVVIVCVVIVCDRDLYGVCVVFLVCYICGYGCDSGHCDLGL